MVLRIADRVMAAAVVEHLPPSLLRGRVFDLGLGGGDRGFGVECAVFSGASWSGVARYALRRCQSGELREGQAIVCRLVGCDLGAVWAEPAQAEGGPPPPRLPPAEAAPPLPLPGEAAPSLLPLGKVAPPPEPPPPPPPGEAVLRRRRGAGERTAAAAERCKDATRRAAGRAWPSFGLSGQHGYGDTETRLDSLHESRRLHSKQRWKQSGAIRTAIAPRSHTHVEGHACGCVGPRSCPGSASAKLRPLGAAQDRAHEGPVIFFP